MAVTDRKYLDQYDRTALDQYIDHIVAQKKSHAGRHGQLRGVDLYSDRVLIEVVTTAVDLFLRTNGYLPHLMSPRTFNEYIFRRKFLEIIPIPHLCSKFYTNRRVASAYGKEYAADIVYAGTSSADMVARLKKEPAGTYFLKSDHGSALNKKIDWHPDLPSSDIESIVGRAEYYLNHDFGYDQGEWQYCCIPKMILIERSLTKQTIDPVDYRFFVFDGVARFINIDTQSYERQDRKVTFLDENFKMLDMKYDKYPRDEALYLPVNISEMKALAEEISKWAKVPFIRIDMYAIDGQPVVGEFTYTPTNGTIGFTPDKYNYVLGEFWRKSSLNYPYQ